MAEERSPNTSSLSPQQRRVVLHNRAEAHLTRATKLAEYLLASSKKAYTEDLLRIDARLEKEYKTICEKAYLAKAEDFET